MTTEKITTSDVTTGDVIQSRTDPRVRLTVQEVVGPSFARHPNGEPGGEWTFKGIVEAEDVPTTEMQAASFTWMGNQTVYRVLPDTPPTSD